MFPRAILPLALLFVAPLAQSDPGLDTSNSELRPVIQRYTVDRNELFRYFGTTQTPARYKRLTGFYTQASRELDAIDFNTLSQDGRIDFILFRNELQHELRRLDRYAREQQENAAYLPFAEVLTGLEDARRMMLPIDPPKAAELLTRLRKQIDDARRSQEEAARAASDANAARSRRIVGARAAEQAASLRNTLRAWFNHYNGYDPLFTWWAAEAYASADRSLETYATFLHDRVAGLPSSQPAESSSVPSGRNPNRTTPTISAARPGSTDDIVGNPIGRDGLMTELAYEMIPYTPEQLIVIANKEFAWCENEMKRASREMGFGDDWKKALEKIKTMHVEPGKQPELIRSLALEAEKFIDDHELVTIPALAREDWRIEMMSPERQLVNPFFLGGDNIIVSYPTSNMTYEQKMMGMRGNNIPMARATVFHELIPGHHLQGYYAARYKPYRQAIGGTPFVTEGWALYWELMMWELKFQKTPEDRVGALFWRMHRCARIIFSLSFHLGKMSPAECVDFLVERVGHERENAAGEVRRSFEGDYGPLYQAAYLLGGMQIKALHDQLVGAGKLTERQFNDAVLRENRIPIEMIRASLTNQPLARDYTTSWKFYGAVN